MYAFFFVLIEMLIIIMLEENKVINQN